MDEKQKKEVLEGMTEMAEMIESMHELITTKEAQRLLGSYMGLVMGIIANIDKKDLKALRKAMKEIQK